MKCRGMGRAMKPVAMKKGGKPPKGFHYMPDGSLMADSAHKKSKGGANRLAQQAAIAINMKKRGKKPNNA